MGEMRSLNAGLSRRVVVSFVPPVLLERREGRTPEISGGYQPFAGVIYYLLLQAKWLLSLFPYFRGMHDHDREHHESSR